MAYEAGRSPSRLGNAGVAVLLAHNCSFSRSLSGGGLLVVLDVPAVGAGGGELAQLVTDHRLGDEPGTCLRPSCTAMVCPMMSGMIIDRRDQVLMTFLVPFSFCASHLLLRVVVDEGTLLQAAWHLVITCSNQRFLPDLRRRTIRRTARLVLVAGAASGLPHGDRVTATGGATLATTVRVVDRVHHHAADGRADALPPVAAGLAPVDVRLCSALPTSPTVARQRTSTMRISPDGNAGVASSCPRGRPAGCGHRRCGPSWRRHRDAVPRRAPWCRPGCCAAAGCCRA